MIKTTFKSYSTTVTHTTTIKRVQRERIYILLMLLYETNPVILTVILLTLF